MEIFIQVVGWVGTVLLILAYILVSSENVGPKSAVYQFMNLFGAIGVGINVFYSQSWPALVVNIFWGSIALWALLKLPLAKGENWRS
ncbi:MAG: hypothetical protein WC791_01070 [Candidatus Paceibacterota bacterium]|jgi:hypothetical protein